MAFNIHRRILFRALHCVSSPCAERTPSTSNYAMLEQWNGYHPVHSVITKSNKLITKSLESVRVGWVVPSFFTLPSTSFLFKILFKKRIKRVDNPDNPDTQNEILRQISKLQAKCFTQCFTKPGHFSSFPDTRLG
jgi:hypothetical protein